MKIVIIGGIPPNHTSLAFNMCFTFLDLAFLSIKIKVDANQNIFAHDAVLFLWHNKPKRIFLIAAVVGNIFKKNHYFFFGFCEI